MGDKAEQGHWPSVAPIGYVNNLSTHRIERLIRAAARLSANDRGSLCPAYTAHPAAHRVQPCGRQAQAYS